jgi:hypothetical protein
MRLINIEMKVKIFVIILLYLSGVICLVVCQSCEGFLSYKASVCDIEFYGLGSKRFDVQPDTMTTDVGFVILAHPSQICHIQPAINIISACYATTKCAKWQNEILPSSFKLSLNKQVIISTETIPANTDLFRNSHFIAGVYIAKDKSDCKNIEYTIKFSSDLLNKTIFEEGIYDVTFTCNTNDRRTFVEHRQAVFKL